MTLILPPSVPCPTNILPHLPSPNDQLLAILQHKEHPRPLRLAAVPPPMIRAPLHRHVSPPHPPRHPIVQNHLHLSFNHDPIVQTLRTMHYWFRAGAEIHYARNRAVRVRETELLFR